MQSRYFSRSAGVNTIPTGYLYGKVRTSTVSTRIDKAATRTLPEKLPERTRNTRKSTDVTGPLHGPFTEVYVFYWDIPGVLTDDVTMLSLILSNIVHKNIWSLFYFAIYFLSD